MLDQGNRTFIGSVVFVDIVGYSKCTVSDQITIKERFTKLLSDALVDIPPEQRLILDTGDGAALSFLGDPEDALFVSMSMRDKISRAAVADGTPQLSAQLSEMGETGAMRESGETAGAGLGGPLPVRIGINLGPVKLVRDINGHPNIVGDGINVAQRIMSFSQPGQIVVSRSFYDVVSVISDEYAKLFRYEGSRTDKHVREHEIYVVGESDIAFDKVKAGMVDRAASTNPSGRPPGPGVSTGTHSRRAISGQAEPLPFLQDRRKLAMAGALLSAIVLSLIFALAIKKPGSTPTDVAAMAKNAATTKPDTPNSSAGSAIVQPRAPAKPAEPNAAPTESATPTGNAAVANTPVIAVEQKAGPAKTETAKPEASKPVATGTLNFQINPWGDVYVNGKSIGVSPPLKQHKLPPGKYRIEVKNTSFTPYVASVEVKAKEDISVKYTFR